MPGIEQSGAIGWWTFVHHDVASQCRRPADCAPIDACDVDRVLPPLPFALYLERQNQASPDRAEAGPAERADARHVIRPPDTYEPSAPCGDRKDPGPATPARHGLRSEWDWPDHDPRGERNQSPARIAYERRAIGTQGQLIDVLL